MLIIQYNCCYRKNMNNFFYIFFHFGFSSWFWSRLSSSFLLISRKHLFADGSWRLVVCGLPRFAPGAERLCFPGDQRVLRLHVLLNQHPRRGRHPLRLESGQANGSSCFHRLCLLGANRFFWVRHTHTNVYMYVYCIDILNC